MAVSGLMLSELILGSADDEVAIAISGLTLSDTVSLRRLVLTNISTLSGVLDLSVCSHIREVYATGTALTQISLPSGGALQHIEYPDTNQYIQLHNFQLLQTDNVVVGDGLSVIDFFVDNCPQLDAFSILLQIFTAQESLSAVNLKHIRITGVNSTINSSMLDAIAHLADGRFAGLDADGLASDAYPLPVREVAALGNPDVPARPLYALARRDGVVHQVAPCEADHDGVLGEGHAHPRRVAVHHFLGLHSQCQAHHRAKKQDSSLHGAVVCLPHCSGTAA